MEHVLLDRDDGFAVKAQRVLGDIIQIPNMVEDREVRRVYRRERGRVAFNVDKARDDDFEQLLDRQEALPETCVADQLA